MKKYKLLGSIKADGFGPLPMKESETVYEGTHLTTRDGCILIMDKPQCGPPIIICAIPVCCGVIVKEIKG